MLMMIRKDNISADLPVTMGDYITICHKNDLRLLKAVRGKLRDLESKLTTLELARQIISDGLEDIGVIVSPYKAGQALALESFAEACRHFGGKPIFWAFIPESTKYLQGGIIPITREHLIIVYLPQLAYYPKVLYSPDLDSQSLVDFLITFVGRWIEEAKRFAASESSV